MVDRYKHCLSANSYSVFRHKKLDGDCVLYSAYSALEARYAELEKREKLLWEYFELEQNQRWDTTEQTVSNDEIDALANKINAMKKGKGNEY